MLQICSYTFIFALVKCKNVMQEMKRLDFIGMSASIVCAAHCSVLPLAITYGLLGGSVALGHGIFEIAFILLSVYLAVSSLYSSFKKYQHNLAPIALFAGGLLFVTFGLLFHTGWEFILATLGGLAIASAHYWNYRLNAIFAKSH